MMEPEAPVCVLRCMKTTWWVGLALLCTVAVPHGAAQDADVPHPRGVRWAKVTDAAAVDGQRLEALYAGLEKDEHRDLKGIVILRDGQLVSERYFNGDSAASLHDIRSATKSITSLLMGMAIDKRLVHGVGDSIARYLPGLPKDGKEKITIQDLLNMRSGLDADDDDPATAGNEDRLDESQDWMKTVYAVPSRGRPGERYLYCSLNAFLTGAIVENASGMSLDTFAQANLFRPLGIFRYEWRHVPVNRTTGQGNLSITARDAAAIGEMVRKGGRVDGKRIVAQSWITRSIASQVAIGKSDPYADAYGYMWYTRAEPVGDQRVEVHFASGNGGNKIYIVPSRHMVVAITSSAYGHGYGQRRSQEILLKVLAGTR